MIVKIIFALAIAAAVVWSGIRMAAGVDFAHPYLLFAMLAAIPATWWSFRGTGRVAFSSLRVLPASGSTWRTKIAWLPDLMMGVAVACLAIALSGPRRGDESSRVRREGIAVMMAIDVSGSMRAEDLADTGDDTRLDTVKKMFERFVLGSGPKLLGRPDDAIGLVAFARYAETRSPLTLDHGNLVTAARKLDFAREDEDGTAIGAGLALAVARLSDFKAKSRVAILLTDGVSNFHEIDEDAAIDEAVQRGIKVYTIGAGTTGVAPVRVTQGGRTQVVQIPVEIDETTLKKIATKTGGKYFRAKDASALADIYGQIDTLERTKIEEKRFTQFHEFYERFVILALALVAAALALRTSILRRLP